MGETKPATRVSKGRQRIVIAPIANRDRRQVTCSKRKAGFFKKASEMALLCGARVAAVLFSGAGKVYAFGSPSVDGVLRGLDAEGGAPYLLDDDGTERAAVEATMRKKEEAAALVAKEQARTAAVGDKVLRAVAPGGRRFWWQADVQQLGEAELPEFTRALVRLRDNVQRHADKLSSSNAAAVMPAQS